MAFKPTPSASPRIKNPRPRPDFASRSDAEHIDVHEVASVIGCCVDTIWRGVRNGRFPKPYKFFGLRSTRWNVGELRAVIASAKAA